MKSERKQRQTVLASNTEKNPSKNLLMAQKDSSKNELRKNEAQQNTELKTDKTDSQMDETQKEEKVIKDEVFSGNEGRSSSEKPFSPNALRAMESWKLILQQDEMAKKYPIKPNSKAEERRLKKRKRAAKILRCISQPSGSASALSDSRNDSDSDNLLNREFSDSFSESDDEDEDEEEKPNGPKKPKKPVNLKALKPKKSYSELSINRVLYSKSRAKFAEKCSICHNFGVGFFIDPCTCYQSKPVHFHCLKPLMISQQSLRCNFCNEPYTGMTPIYEQIPKSLAVNRSFSTFLIMLVLLVVKYTLFVAHDYHRFMQSFLWFLMAIALSSLYVYVAMLFCIAKYNTRNNKMIDVHIEPNKLVVDV